jgi:predicted transcriptional regulator
MAEIMEAAKGGELKTRIMYMVNLSFSQVNEYLSFLANKGFLKVITQKGKKVYETTTKGILYIENYKQMADRLNIQEVAETQITT